MTVRSHTLLVENFMLIVMKITYVVEYKEIMLNGSGSLMSLRDREKLSKKLWKVASFYEC